jgi:hypothetical protein
MEEITTLERNRDEELRIIEMIVKDQIEQLVIGKKLAATLKKGKKVFIAKDAAVAEGDLAEVPMAQMETPGARRRRADRIGPRHPGTVSSSVRSCQG